jgi:hydrogenase expression/formation protein HypC
VNALLEDLIHRGVPALVLEISDDGLVATVDFFGEQRELRLDLVDSRVSPGDYVLDHVGYAIRRIPEEDIAETLARYKQMLRGVTGESEEEWGA